jgi:hypothetical protein
VSYQIINAITAVPGRLQATLLAFENQKNLSKAEIAAICQPSTENQSMTEENIKAAVELALLSKDKEIYTLNVNINKVKCKAELRTVIAENILANPVTTRDNNCLIPLFAAWSFCQNSGFQKLSVDDRRVKFNEKLRLSGGAEFNRVKYDSWCMWASFLGLGFSLDSDFVPCPFLRIKDQLTKLFEGQNRLPIGTFMKKLAISCPEVDGGTTFELFTSDRPLHNVSMAVSNALRLLQKVGTIQLDRVSDAESITLAEGEPASISHVEWNRV